VNVADEGIFLKAVFIVARLQRFEWNINMNNHLFLWLVDYFERKVQVRKSEERDT